jgi:NAD(P)-dependent dehydrogenase (short-subunit alcohol dehydrogenase family)
VTTFQGKGILITGAGRGIGKRLAIGFASAGARVGLLARSKAELDLANLEIEHAEKLSLRLRADVRDFEELTAAVEKMNVQYGGVHVLICAAGVLGPIGPLASVQVKDWADALSVNVMGAVHACRAVLPQMIERRSGKIIFLSGDGADQPRPNFSSYAASKAALVRFAETLAAEVLDYNVQVNCLDPGNSYTSMTDEILAAANHAGPREFQEAAEVRRTGGVAPDKQIQLAMFLASERSNHITGKLIGVNDNWKRLEHGEMRAEAYTLRRLQKV